MMRFKFGRKHNENKATNEGNEKSDMSNMTHITIGRKYNTNKVANVECKKNNSLENIDIKGQCFLLIFLKSGSLTFCLNGNENVFPHRHLFVLMKRKIQNLFQIIRQIIIVYIFILTT